MIYVYLCNNDNEAPQLIFDTTTVKECSLAHIFKIYWGI